MMKVWRKDVIFETSNYVYSDSDLLSLTSKRITFSQCSCCCCSCLTNYAIALIVSNLQTSVDDLFSLSEGQEESLVGVACLCVVANLSLTKYCHPEIAAYSSRLFELLEDEDTALLKQVLTILLNLCCERSTVPALLTAKVSCRDLNIC